MVTCGVLGLDFWGDRGGVALSKRVTVRYGLLESPRVLVKNVI